MPLLSCRLSSLHHVSSQPSQGFSSTFDAFARTSADATPNSVSGQDSPSDTLSRHSALSAFAESLKQPALMDTDADLGSPLSDSKSDSKPPKTSKRSHRRSTSEPAAIENWNLVADQ